MRRIAHLVLAACWLPLLAVASALPRRRARRLVWTATPLINYQHWSKALSRKGWQSETLVSEVYRISRREDFDVVFADLAPKWAPEPARAAVAPYLAAMRVIRRADVVHLDFGGGPLATTPLWRHEPRLYRRANVRTVVLPYGADVARYSMLPDPLVRDAMLASYPRAGREEAQIARRVNLWTAHADCIIAGFNLEGLGRWDVPVGNMLAIDPTGWDLRAHSDADGHLGPVRVVHAPNHRGAKGTADILAAVEDLRREGLQIELTLLEGKQNREVLATLREADILADQLILPGYGLAAVEGMATGLPVLAALAADPLQLRFFKLRSFVGACPVVPSSPETVTDDLRRLVTDPGLRARLGAEGRRYVEDFHSYETAAYLFESVYSKLLDGDDVDLRRLFDPQTSAYVAARRR